MSALARYWKSEGYDLSGYDKTRTHLTETLEEEGISVGYEDNPRLYDALKKENTRVVYTPAVPLSSELFQFVKANGLKLQKRSEALAEICNVSNCIAVAGTHGKTSTATLIAHLLIQSGIHTRAFLGGISVDYESNYLYHKSEGDEWVVVEADEFDRSFLRLYPTISVITSCEADHLDVYGAEESLQHAFREFIQNTREGGKTIVHEGSAKILSPDSQSNIVVYGGRAEFRYENISIDNHRFQFDLPALGLSKIKTELPGEYNIQNATAALCAASLVANERLNATAISNFKGARRRFDLLIDTEEIVYIDDYAHHPTELKAVMETVNLLYPERSLTVVFQPHLYSRTRDFMSGFRSALSMANKCLLLPIYPAREEAIPGVSSDALSKGLDNTEVISKDALLAELAKIKPSLLLTLGAGDIDKLVPEIVNYFQPVEEGTDEN